MSIRLHLSLISKQGGGSTGDLAGDQKQDLQIIPFPLLPPKQPLHFSSVPPTYPLPPSSREPPRDRKAVSTSIQEHVLLPALPIGLGETSVHCQQDRGARFGWLSLKLVFLNWFAAGAFSFCTCRNNFEFVHVQMWGDKVHIFAFRRNRMQTWNLL